MTGTQPRLLPPDANEEKELPLSPPLARELEAIERGIRAREEAQRRPAPTKERLPRPYAYD